MKILIAAGGTGGHIYPALAIADALKVKGVEVEFVGTAHGLENKIIPPKGYRVNHLPIGRLNSNVPLTERLKTAVSLPFAFGKSATLLRRKKPDLVLGVGGHASGPLLLVASMLGYRTSIWEPNAMPGMANRILSRFVDECWVVFEEARARLKARTLNVAGMPVRKEIEDAKRTVARSSERFRVLVFGGSQGARGINNTTLEMMKAAAPEWRAGIRLVHQTGPTDFARIKEGYGDLADEVEVREYLHDMDRRYDEADLVVCRSGTGTLSELAACGKAAVLIPFPYAADDHQKKNAESLVAKDAAVLIDQKNLTAEALRATIDELRADPARRERMERNIRRFHHPRAAETLATKFVERIQSASR